MHALRNYRSGSNYAHSIVLAGNRPYRYRQSVNRLLGAKSKGSVRLKNSQSPFGSYRYREQYDESKVSEFQPVVDLQRRESQLQPKSSIEQDELVASKLAPNKAPNSGPLPTRDINNLSVNSYDSHTEKAELKQPRHIDKLSLDNSLSTPNKTQTSEKGSYMSFLSQLGKKLDSANRFETLKESGSKNLEKTIREASTPRKEGLMDVSLDVRQPNRSSTNQTNSLHPHKLGMTTPSQSKILGLRVRQHNKQMSEDLNVDKNNLDSSKPRSPQKSHTMTDKKGVAHQFTIDEQSQVSQNRVLKKKDTLKLPTVLQKSEVQKQPAADLSRLETVAKKTSLSTTKASPAWFKPKNLDTIQSYSRNYLKGVKKEKGELTESEDEELLARKKTPKAVTQTIIQEVFVNPKRRGVAESQIEANFQRHYCAHSQIRMYKW